jgi:hypothetical protein
MLSLLEGSLDLTDFYFRVRIDPHKSFTGHINVTIMDMSLVKLHQQHMLMCSEW